MEGKRGTQARRKKSREKPSSNDEKQFVEPFLAWGCGLEIWLPRAWNEKQQRARASAAAEQGQDCMLSWKAALLVLAVLCFQGISTGLRLHSQEMHQAMCWRTAFRGRLLSRACFSSSRDTEKKSLVFMGTPEVAANCLRILHGAALRGEGGGFNISAVVTQPPAPTGRKRVLTNSPVQSVATSLGIPVLHPATASDSEFLSTVEKLNPDVCITMAYGQYLPSKLLAIPRHGTINIHPSLLPLYRGAAPIQRCIASGDKETGVTLLFSVKKMDAGPILAQVQYALDENVSAPKALQDCMEIGVRELLKQLPKVFDGKATVREQDHARATTAPKLTSQDSLVDIVASSAKSIHDRCRGYADWPGIHSFFFLRGQSRPTKIKILSTRLLSEEQLKAHAIAVTVPVGSVQFVKSLGMLAIKCGDGMFLGVTDVHVENKNAASASAFVNGFGGQFSMACAPNPHPSSPADPIASPAS